MKEYIKFETKLFLKNRRNQFLFLGVAVFLIGLLVYIPYQNTNDIEEKISVEAQAVRNAIAYVPLHEVEAGTYMENYEYYDALLAESQAIATQEVALTMFDDLEQYVHAGLQVTNARIQAHEQGYGTLPNEFIVPLSQSLREQEMYNYLQNNNIQIAPDSEDAANTSVLAITWFSTVSFFFLLFISCDVLTEDEEHETIISAYPIDSNQKVIGKLIIQTFATLVILMSLFVGGYVLSSLVFGAGTLQYPTSLYWRGEFTAVPIYLFVAAFMGLFLIFVIHMILFSAVLNIVFRNKYLTLFAGGFLYIFGFLFSQQLSFLHFTPLNYLDPAGILSGQLAVQFNQSGNDLLTAVAVLGSWSVIYGLVLSFVFARKNRVRIKEPAGGKVG